MGLLWVEGASSLGYDVASLASCGLSNVSGEGI